MSLRVTIDSKFDMKGLHNLVKKYPKTQKTARVGHFDGTPHMFSRHLSYADLSYIQQLGTEQNGKQHIPPRPYMKIALSSPAFCKRYNEVVKEIVQSRASGRATKAISIQIRKLAIELMEITKGVIQTSFGLVENADSTIEMKGSSIPLIETGNMISDIEYKLINDTSRHLTGYDPQERNV